MADIVASIIDIGLVIIVSIVALRYYFKPAATHFYRKKWLLVAVGLLLLSNVLLLGIRYWPYFLSRIPSQNAVITAMRNTGHFATNEFMFSSRDGYDILIPEGYTYVSDLGGGLSLTALNDYSSICVIGLRDVKNTDQTIGEIIAELPLKFPSFKLYNRCSVRVGDSEGVRIDYGMTSSNILCAATMIFCKKGATSFQLVLSCADTQLPRFGKEKDRVISSFRIK